MRASYVRVGAFCQLSREESAQAGAKRAPMRSHAGGIMSAAIDGARSAQALLDQGHAG